MARPIPSHGPNFYCGTQANTDGNHAFQQGEDLNFLADAGLSRAYPTSRPGARSNSTGSNNVQPYITTLVGFHGTASDFSEASLLPVGPFFTQNVLFENQIASSDSAAFHMGLDTFFPTALETGSIFPMALDVNGYFPVELDNLLPTLGVNNQITPLANVPAGPASFENLGNLVVCDEGLLAADNETILLSNQVPWIEPLDNGGSDAMDVDVIINSISHQQYSVERNTLALAVAMPQECSNITSSDAIVASFGVGPLFQGRPNWDWGVQGHTTILASPPPSNTRSSEMAPESYNVVSAGRDAVLQDVAPSSLMPALEERPQEPRPIQAKPVAPRDMFIHLDGNEITKKPLRKPGRRSPLDAQAKENAAFMRIKHACAHCFVNNLKCSNHDICTRCRKPPRSPFFGILCHRSRLQDYVEVFLPSFLIEHLRRVAIEQLTSSLEFTDNEYVVHLSTGRTHPPITVLVSKIVPPDEDFLLVSHLAPEMNDHMRTFATVRSLQYAMRNYSVDQVMQKCRDHIEAISKPRNITGDSSTLRCKLLLVICRFLEAVPISKESNLLRNAVMMNRIQYVMGRHIVVNGNSSLNHVESLEHQSEFPPMASLSARVLTRQIKGIMNLLLEDLTKKVLQELDWQLRKRGTEYGLIYLCTYLVLCMCAEELQVAIDGFVLFKSSSESPSRDGDPSHIVQRGTEACGKLEKETLENSWILLNAILKRILKKHNPFRYRSEMECEPGQNEPKANLMKDLRQLMDDHDNEISTKSADQYHGGCSRLVIDHKIFCRRNPGRLISKILKELR